MKREMLRIHNLNTESKETTRLMNVSLCLMGGTNVGLLGLAHSGKSVLVEVLCGIERKYKGSIYIDEKRILDFKENKNLVYRITNSNYMIDDWTAAEYIGLVEAKSLFGFFDSKKLVEKTKQLFDMIGLNINPNKKIKDLSELEKRLVDLIKACSLGSKIVIIEDEFEGCSAEDIQHFRKLMDRTGTKERLILVNCNSNNVQSILTDWCIIFKKGWIVKKCKKEYIRSSTHLERFMLEQGIYSKKEDLDSYKIVPQTGQEVVMSMHHIILSSGERYQFNFCKATVYAVLTLNIKKKEELFRVLSGRSLERCEKLLIDGELCNYKNVMEYVEHKIVSIAHMGDKDELLQDMSAGENLLVPSLRKISTWEYITSEHKMSKMLEKEFGTEVGAQEQSVKFLTTNDCIGLILERWYVYKPKVLVLFEPFMNCDVYGVSLVKSYIKKFVEIDTAVIIVKSRIEYIEDISDQIIEIT
ncbi:MAG: ATP-binding cassette domain-containing protein [Lachnospiraceae bacterium]